MQVSPVDLASLGIDVLRGIAKDGTGWPEHNRDEKWDWKYYCAACKLEIKKPYICVNERVLNRSVYSPETPNWSFNRPPSRQPRCPKCRELDTLQTKQERIDWYRRNIAQVSKEKERLENFSKKWKKFRKKHNNLLSQGGRVKIGRDDLGYNASEMWQCHLNTVQYIEDTEGLFMPRSKSTESALKLVWELDHKYRVAKQQNEEAELMLNSAHAEVKKQDFTRALSYLDRGVRERIDRCDIYLARADVFFATGQYDKCVADASIVIAMIEEVHTQLKHAGIYVQALRLRATAQKFQSNLLDAQHDLELALEVDDEDLESKRLLTEVETLLLLNQDAAVSSEDVADELLFTKSFEFFIVAQDKNNDAEQQMFSSLFALLQKSPVFYKRFIAENGVEVSINYVRLKLKSCTNKKALQEVSRPGLDALMRIIDDVVIENGVRNRIKLASMQKLICNTLLCMLTVYAYLYRETQRLCRNFLTHMFASPVIRAFLKLHYLKPLMEKFKKLVRKIKVIRAPEIDKCFIDCMLSLFDRDDDDEKHAMQSDDDEKHAMQNDAAVAVAQLYDQNELFYAWMSKYLPYHQQLSPADQNYQVSCDNVLSILRGVRDTIAYMDDSEFYMLYNETRHRYLASWIAFFVGLGQLNADNISSNNIELITACFAVLDALLDKEQGRKALLQPKYRGLHRNMHKMIVLVKNKEIAHIIKKYFRSLCQQQQDNEEYQVLLDQAAAQKRKIDEMERIEIEKAEKKFAEQRQREEEEEKQSKERINKPDPKPGDLDTVSSDDDDDDEDAYLKDMMDTEHSKQLKRKKKDEEKARALAKKKVREQLKHEHISEIDTSKFVPQRPPATFVKETLVKVFGDDLTEQDIEAILSL